MPRIVPLYALPSEGTNRFKVVATGKSGTLVSVNNGSCSVQMDGTRHKAFTVKSTGQRVEFDEPTEKVGPVCRGLEVEPLPPLPTKPRGARAGDGRSSQVTLKGAR